MSEYYQPTRKDLEAQRPGCQDFLDIPSRRGDERVPYMEPLGMCVGKLKDNKEHAN